jgi:transcriptional regulator with XRE-family HTH domain
MNMKKAAKKHAGTEAPAARGDLRPSRQRVRLTPGQALKTVRQLQDMTQAQLAEASGIPQATISAMEHDRVTIGAERARPLARALRVHPAVLVFADWSNEDADTTSNDRPRRGTGHKHVA